MSFSTTTNSKWTIKESKTNLNKSYDVTVPYETFTEWANANRGTKEIKGFRLGKAPLSSFKDEWILECARTIAHEIINEEGFKNVFDSSYSVQNFKIGEEIKLTINIDLYPEIPAIDFSKINLTEHVLKIGKEDIAEAIANWTKTNFKPVALSEPKKTELNDYVNISVELGDVKGKKEKINNMDIQIGKNTFLPEIEAKLIGKDIRESIEHEFIIPENGTLIKDTSLAGKTMQITFTINKIQGSQNCNEKDMLLAFGTHSKEELEKKVENNLIAEARKFTDHLLKESLKQELAKFYFEIPMDLIYTKHSTFRMQMLNDLGYKEGEDLEKLVQEKLQLNLDEFEQRTIMIAEALARSSFLIMHLGKELGISISALELDDAIADHKKMFPNGLQDAVKFFEENAAAKSNLKNNLLEDKILRTLIAQCTMSQKTHVKDDFYNLKPIPESPEKISETKISDTKEEDQKKTASSKTEQNIAKTKKTTKSTEKK